MSDPHATTQVLQHGGADLAFETSGAGPHLLILSAGMDGSAVAGPVAERLAQNFTTIRFDRRGLGRSATSPGSSAAGEALAAHADDAAALVTAIASGPVFVFGASIGALVGIELLARHPSTVRHVVLHEPPIEHLVPDPARSAKLDEVRRRAVDDVVGAVRGFGEIVGSGDVRELDAPEPGRMPNPGLTLQNFFRRDFEAVRGYRVDTDALRAAAGRLTLTSGAHSAGRFEARCSVELATQLDMSVHTIDAGHNPVADFPRALASFLTAHLIGPTQSSTDPPH